MAGQPVTVKVADATLPLWRPLTWKVSFLPGYWEPAKPLGTANDAETWPPAVALAVASTVAPKAMATCSEGVNPRQERVTRDPASPALGERTQVGLAWLATVKVADAVLPLWRPLAWKVSRRPGMVEPAKSPGTAN